MSVLITEQNLDKVISKNIEKAILDNELKSLNSQKEQIDSKIAYLNHEKNQLNKKIQEEENKVNLLFCVYEEDGNVYLYTEDLLLARRIYKNGYNFKDHIFLTNDDLNSECNIGEHYLGQKKVSIFYNNKFLNQNEFEQLMTQ